MVKYITIFVCLAVFAVSLSAQTDNAIFSQTYVFENMRGMLSAEILADDFVPEFSGDVNYVVLWMVHTQGPPANIFLSITKDNGDNNPNTATPVTSGLSPATHVDTGTECLGNPVYQTTCTLPSAASVSAGETYWLEAKMPSFNSFWCAQQPLVFGSTMWVYHMDQFVTTMFLYQQEFDSFFELHDLLALEGNSWGAIKASF
ncbi:MAG: hypothetical protein GQ565_04185 [Candidatus Aegiribacteria sp.]|nr:hypothetical protein [Candidatus Aegiribacteria sp.]